MNQKNKSIILSLCMLFLWDCSTSTVARSMEFTTAKTSARSEKNLKKAEEYGLQALAMEAHANDASVPYFLAIEIYKPQKNGVKMAEMLDEAKNVLGIFMANGVMSCGYATLIWGSSVGDRLMGVRYPSM